MAGLHGTAGFEAETILDFFWEKIKNLNSVTTAIIILIPSFPSEPCCIRSIYLHLLVNIYSLILTPLSHRSRSARAGETASIQGREKNLSR